VLLRYSLVRSQFGNQREKKKIEASPASSQCCVHNIAKPAHTNKIPFLQFPPVLPRWALSHPYTKLSSCMVATPSALSFPANISLDTLRPLPLPPPRLVSSAPPTRPHFCNWFLETWNHLFLVASHSLSSTSPHFRLTYRLYLLFPKRPCRVLFYPHCRKHRRANPSAACCASQLTAETRT
jgi:hypothetical protein